MDLGLSTLPDETLYELHLEVMQEFAQRDRAIQYLASMARLKLGERLQEARWAFADAIAEVREAEIDEVRQRVRAKVLKFPAERLGITDADRELLLAEAIEAARPVRLNKLREECRRQASALSDELLGITPGESNKMLLDEVEQRRRTREMMLQRDMLGYGVAACSGVEDWSFFGDRDYSIEDRLAAAFAADVPVHITVGIHNSPNSGAGAPNFSLIVLAATDNPGQVSGMPGPEWLRINYARDSRQFRSAIQFFQPGRWHCASEEIIRVLLDELVDKQASKSFSGFATGGASSYSVGPWKGR